MPLFKQFKLYYNKSNLAQGIWFAKTKMVKTHRDQDLC